MFPRLVVLVHVYILWGFSLLITNKQVVPNSLVNI